MADKTILEAEVKTNIKSVTKDVKGLDKATDDAAGGFKTLGSTIKGIGTALKALGIGFVVALVAKFMEVLSKNQKVVDAFNTSMTALDIVFNDLIRLLDESITDFSGYLKEMFEDPTPKIKEMGKAIQESLLFRFNKLIEGVGILAKGISQLFSRDFKGALKTAREFELVVGDAITGVDDSTQKLIDTVSEYTNKVIENSTALTESNKVAQLSIVENAKLNAIYQKQAEDLRQLRDDETATFTDRIKANEELSKVLEKQQKLQLEQAANAVDAAQRQKDILNNLPNQIALEEALTRQLEIKEQINGQISEQLTNQKSLERELLEVQNEIRAEGLRGVHRELEELETAYKLRLDMARKAEMDETAITKEFNRQRAEIIATNTQEQLAAYSELAGGLQALAGDNKALAVAQAIMDTYAGANKAFAEGGTIGFVTGAAIIAQGLANVQKILSTPIPGGEGGGGSVPSAPQTPAPQMLGGSFDLSGGVAPEPIQAYVVSDDVTNNQDKLAAIRRRATI